MPSTVLRSEKKKKKKEEKSEKRRTLQLCPMNTRAFLSGISIHLEPRNDTGGKQPPPRTAVFVVQGNTGRARSLLQGKYLGRELPIPSLLLSSLKTFSLKAKESNGRRKGRVKGRFCFWLSPVNSCQSKQPTVNGPQTLDRVQRKHQPEGTGE